VAWLFFAAQAGGFPDSSCISSQLTLLEQFVRSGRGDFLKYYGLTCPQTRNYLRHAQGFLSISEGIDNPARQDYTEAPTREMTLKCHIG